VQTHASDRWLTLGDMGLDKDRRRVRQTLGRWLEYTHRAGRRKAIRRGAPDRSQAAGDDLFTLDLSPLGKPTEND